MLSIFKSFDKMLDSFDFNFEAKREALFKDLNFEKIEESGKDDNSTWKSETWTSPLGNVSYYKKVTKYTPKQEKEPSLEELKDQLEKAVKEQKYENAIKLRDRINKIEKGAN